MVVMGTQTEVFVLVEVVDKELPLLEMLESADMDVEALEDVHNVA